MKDDKRTETHACDLISRQAALTALNGCTEIFLNNLPPTIYKTDAVEAVTALPSAQPGWIPCDVRTPKYVEESYWICTDTGYQCQCRWTNDVWGLGASDKWAWKLLDIPQYSRVVAWMPLPKPWEG